MKLMSIVPLEMSVDVYESFIRVLQARVNDDDQMSRDLNSINRVNSNRESRRASQ